MQDFFVIQKKYPIISACKGAFFSFKDPSQKNIPLIKKTLHQLFDFEKSLSFSTSSFSKKFLSQLALFEVLSKGIAYIDHLDMKTLLLPWNKKKIAFLIQKIPFGSSLFAYGLIAKDQTVPSFLLFPGAKCFPSAKKRALSSIDALFSRQGLGWCHFQKYRDRIQEWLAKQQDKKVIAIGHSLGGAFASYSALFFPEIVTQAFLFNTPGVGKKIFQQWQKVRKKTSIFSIQRKGDIFAKLGRHFIGELCCIQPTESSYSLLARHNDAVFLKPSWKILKKPFSNNWLIQSFFSLFKIVYQLFKKALSPFSL